MSPEADNEEFQISVTSLKGDTSALMIHLSLSIADVKQKIRDELAFTASRLLLNDKPLQDTLLVREANLTAGLCVRAAKGKQNLKKRRVNHGPGPRERRRIKAKRAEEQLSQSLNLMTEADRSLFVEQMAGDEEIVKGFDGSESSEPAVGFSELVAGSSEPAVGSSEPVVGSSEPVVGSSEPVRCAEKA